MSKRVSNNSEQAILKAAEEEFLEKGYDGARTTSIAERAGVTHAMLHYFFRTKEQLFDRIVEDKFNLIGASVLLIFGDKSMPLKERLEKGISSYFDFLVANPGLPRFMVNEINHVSNLVEEQVMKCVMPMAAEVQKELDMDVRHLLLDILSLCIFPFLAYPIAKTMYTDEDETMMLNCVKQEIITMIFKRLGLSED